MWSLKRIINVALLALAFNIVISQANAEIIKNITIKSSPSGAQVTQLQGNRRLAKGKTPVQIEATFHSEKSVLRFELASPGFEEKIIKIGASEPNTFVALERSTDIAREEDISDAKAKQMQKKTRALLESVTADFRRTNPALSIQFYEKIRFTNQRGEHLLLIPLEIESTSMNGDLAYGTWKAIYSEFVYPVSKAINNQLGPTKVQINAKHSNDDIVLTPKTKEIESVVMECRGGMTTRYYSSCTGCPSTSHRVWDPCATRVPVTYTNEVIDVDTALGQVDEFIRYEFNSNDVLEINNSQKLYQMINPVVVQ